MGRNAAITLGIGLAIWVWGTLFRIMHWPMAGLLLRAAYIVMLTGAILFVVAAIRNKGLTGLLESRNPDENDL